MTTQEEMQDTQESNKALVRQVIKEVVNEHNPQKIREFVADQFVDHSIFGQSNSVDQLVQKYEEFDSAFPDQRLEIQDVIAEGDKVVVRGTASGTQKGDFQGQASTGKRFNIGEIDIFRIENGKLAEHWDAADTASMFH